MQSETTEQKNITKGLLRLDGARLLNSWKLSDGCTVFSFCVDGTPVSCKLRYVPVIHKDIKLSLNTKSEKVYDFFVGSWELLAEVETSEFLEMLHFLSSSLDMPTYDFAEFSGNVYMSTEGGKVYFMCSDGYRLLRFDMKNFKNIKHGMMAFQCLSILWLTKLSDLPKTIEIYRSNDADELGIIASRGGGESLAFRVPALPHALPNGHRVMPTPEGHFALTVKDLLGVIRYVLSFTKVEQNHVIHCSIQQKEGKFIVQAASEAGQVEAEVSIRDVCMEGFTEFKCNGKFLLEALKVFEPSEVIYLCFHGKYPILQINSGNKNHTIALLQEYV